MIADKQIIKIIMFLVSIIILVIYIGAIFCQVLNTKHIGHDILFITSGNHVWNGGIPIFIIIVIIIIIFKWIIFMLMNIYLFDKMKTRNNIDASLWIKKYIILLCEELEFFVIYINGIKDIILISSPIHILIQFLDLITIIDPIRVRQKNIIFLDVFIKKKKVILLYLGYEPKSLFSLSFYILVYVAYRILISKVLVRF